MRLMPTLMVSSAEVTLSLVKVGTGRQILSGTNGYTGGTNINGGILTANSTTAFGTGAVTINSGCILTLSASMLLILL